MGGQLLKQKILRTIGYAVTLLCFSFLARAIWRMHPDFSQIRSPAAAAALALPIVAGFAGVVFLSAGAWRWVLQFLQGGRLSYRSIADVYVRANIAKYLPGNVMHFAGRNLLAARLGLSQLDVAFSTVTEVAVLLLTACCWAAALAFREFGDVLGRSAALLRAHRPAAAVAAVLLAAGILALLRWLRRRNLWGKYRRFFTGRFLVLCLKLSGVYSLTLLLPGLFLAALYFGMFGGTPDLPSVLRIVAAYTLSWVAGYIVPGAPGGIGVRESVLLIGLTPRFPSGQVLLIAILHRILSILGDAAAFGVLPLLRRGARKQPAELPPSVPGPR